MNKIIKVSYNGSVKFLDGENHSTIASALSAAGVNTSAVLVLQNGMACSLSDAVEYEEDVCILTTSKKETGGIK